MAQHHHFPDSSLSAPPPPRPALLPLPPLQLLAVKFVPRPLPKAAVPLMLAEVELQAQLGEGHVNIITMRELMLTRTHLGLVMDYASGGVRGAWVGGGSGWQHSGRSPLDEGTDAAISGVE